MTYSFRNRIRIIHDVLKLEVAATEFRLSSEASNERIIVQPPSADETKINEVADLVISGSGYATAEAALEAGRKWRQVLYSVFARMGLPVDFGDDDEANITPREVEVLGDGLERVGIVAGDIIYDENRFGLFVHKTEPIRRFLNISMGTAHVRVSVDEDQTHDRTGQALRRYHGIWSDELKLAYTLVHASLANDNPEARFILLVTAVEALIPYRKRVPEVVAVLETLITYVEQLEDSTEEVRDVVVNLLQSDKYESVRSFGLKLADRLTGEYGGLSPRRYSDRVYGMRSDLAHGNLRELPTLGAEALNQQYSELLRFALDMLEAWTPDYSANSTIN